MSVSNYAGGCGILGLAAQPIVVRDVDTTTCLGPAGWGVPGD